MRKKNEGQEVVELSVKVADEEKSLVEKFLVYGSPSLSHDDPELKKCVETALSHFEGVPIEVILKIKMVW